MEFARVLLKVNLLPTQIHTFKAVKIGYDGSASSCVVTKPRPKAKAQYPAACCGVVFISRRFGIEKYPMVLSAFRGDNHAVTFQRPIPH
jgi:hypothetical protein